MDDPRDFALPDPGTRDSTLLRVETTAEEYRAGQWVEAPRVFDRATGELLIDLSDTPWSLEGAYHSASGARLVLRYFPGEEPGVHLEIDAVGRRAVVSGSRSFPVAQTREVMDGIAATYRLRAVYEEGIERLRAASYPATRAADVAASILQLERAISRVSLQLPASAADAALFAPDQPLEALAVAGGWQAAFADLSRAATAQRAAAALVDRLRYRPPTTEAHARKIHRRWERERLRRRITMAAAGVIILAVSLALGYYVSWWVPVALVVLAVGGLAFALSKIRIGW